MKLRVYSYISVCAALALAAGAALPARALSGAPGLPAPPPLQIGVVQDPDMLELPFLAATRGVDARGGPVVTVAWTIISEFNTLGYKVLRSASAGRAGASVVSDGLIAADGGGRSYVWVDVGAPAAAAWYWIEEIELDGVTTNDHGPVLVLAVVIRRAFMALIGR